MHHLLAITYVTLNELEEHFTPNTTVDVVTQI